MEVNQASSVSASNNTGALASSTSALTSDFETFLTLLTTQIQFQDPLNPADSTEFVAQLATFSSVEQQIQTNTLLQAMASQSGVETLGQLANWVGMDVQSSAPLRFSGEDLTLYPQIPATAGSAELVIRDTDGQELGRRALPLPTDSFEWDGRTNDGTRLPQGTYAFEVAAMVGDQVLEAQPVHAYQTVQEVQMNHGQPVVLLESGVTITPSEVLAIRQ